MLSQGISIIRLIPLNCIRSAALKVTMSGIFAKSERMLNLKPPSGAKMSPQIGPSKEKERMLTNQ